MNERRGGFQEFGEKTRYEPYMDRLRALALLATHKDFALHQLVFDTISLHTKRFAVDILENGLITSRTLDSFSDSMDATNEKLGITEDDIYQARKKQRDIANGFWEMRTVIGQLDDTAEAASGDGVSHIIAAAMSGCVIGEYIGLLMLRRHQHKVPVDHMIFSRRGKDPVHGILKPNFRLNGNHVLIVEDAVMEKDLNVMVDALSNFKPDIQMSLTSVQFDPPVDDGYYRQFAHVYPYVT